ncbi:GNAT family N-acetyltransferase [Microcoleus sp. herbarium19]|uniref:GNAT family N-acetyltransferase n=1 Tax=unclassified Microcoleus TaxID=2642155 RepID=UPI002FCF4FBD
MNVKIIDLLASDHLKIQQVATLLVEGFKQHWPDAWPDIHAALQEVQASFGCDRISRIAVGDNGEVLGWIGGIKQYDGNVWELHPLVVKAEFSRQGIGRMLVADLAAEAKNRGGIVLWVGTDDEDNQTTLSGIDLYPNVWEHIAQIRNLRDHPYEFYQKMGFAIVGVMPDANGIGKPDIFMAKRL